jgi:hypothetical protein
MSIECYPTKFNWQEPSKLLKSDTILLLEHWRHREHLGEEPIVWMPKLLRLMEGPRGGRSRRDARVQPPLVTDEEMFELPEGDDTDEERMASDDQSNEADGESSDELDADSSEHGVSANSEMISSNKDTSQEDNPGACNCIMCILSHSICTMV